MGNNSCTAGGATPHICDILVANNTDKDLWLDQSRPCCQSCNHKGFQLTDGKIVQGREPPKLINAHSVGSFSVSGRQCSLVAPSGKVFYRNEDCNLNVTICWSNSSWMTWFTREQTSFDAVISGRPPATREKRFRNASGLVASLFYALFFGLLCAFFCAAFCAYPAALACGVICGSFCGLCRNVFGREWEWEWNKPKPWDEVLIAEGDASSWTMVIRPKKLGDDWKKTLGKMQKLKVI